MIALVVLAGPSARAADGDAAVAGTRLIVRDGSSPKVEYRSSDPFGGITKGDGTDPGTISAEFFFTQTDNGGFSLTVPEGAFDGSSGWKKNTAKRAEYRNALAPAGSPARRLSIAPGRRLQLSARSVDGFAFGGDETPVYTGYCVTNAGETFCHCSAFTDCTSEQSGDGTMLRCRRGGIDPGCRAVTDHKQAFTAQATSSFDEDLCFFGDEDLYDFIEAMLDLGYGLRQGSFDLEAQESTLSSSQLLATGQETLFPFFEGPGSSDESSVALGPGDAIVFMTCTPSGNTVWAYQAFVDKIVQDENDPGVSRRASLGEITLNATNATTDGPTPNMEKAMVVWTADQQTFDDVTQSLATAGITDLPTNLVPIADLTIPDGNGGTVRTLTVDPESYPQAEIGIRVMSLPPPGRTPFRFDRDTRYQFLHFGFDPTRIPVPVGTTKNPFSPPHADLARVSRNFDYLVKQVVRTFENLSSENPPFVHLQLVSDQPFVRQNGVDSTLGIPVSGMEGGGTCLTDELDCAFDDPDSYYAWPGDSILLGDDDYYVVVGLDYANLTGLGGPMARSSRLLFYGYDGGFGLPDDDFDVSSTPLQAFADPDDDHLPRPVDATFTGSISKKARAVVPNAFMVPLTRPQNCSESLPALCPDTDTIGTDQPVFLVSRLSLNPGTGTRPDPAQVIPWRLLHFQVVP